MEALLICAVRTAFIENNIDLTLNFHLIFLERARGTVKAPASLADVFKSHTAPCCVRRVLLHISSWRSDPLGESAGFRDALWQTCSE